jgi:hypothetical protein
MTINYYSQDRLECDICLDLWNADEVNMCPLCEATVCNCCWDEHYEVHKREILDDVAKCSPS